MDSIEESKNIVFEITFFDNIGYYFDWYNNDPKIIKCSDCGKLIKVTSNRQKYCLVCWKEKEIENNRKYARESMRKIRNVKGLENR